MNNNFKLSITRITSSDPIRKTKINSSNTISSTTSEREYGKIISYRSKKEYEQYRRI